MEHEVEELVSDRGLSPQGTVPNPGYDLASWGQSPVRTMIRLAAGVFAIAVAWGALHLQTSSMRSSVEFVAIDLQARAPEEIGVHASDDSAVADDTTLVADKYAPLLDALAPYRRQHVLEALASREIVDVADIVALADRERMLSLVLSNDEYALYEQLRESAQEIESVRALARALEGNAPLSAEQQRVLLMAKLEHKAATAALELTLASTNIEHAAMEEIYASDVATAGLIHHRQQFLDAAHSYLDDTQWLALANQERH